MGDNTKYIHRNQFGYNLGPLLTGVYTPEPHLGACLVSQTEGTRSSANVSPPQPIIRVLFTAS